MSAEPSRPRHLTVTVHEPMVGRNRLSTGVGISSAAPRSYDTSDLFGANSEIEIVHQNIVYRLKITRQGKLILNK